MPPRRRRQPEPNLLLVDAIAPLVDAALAFAELEEPAIGGMLAREQRGERVDPLERLIDALKGRDRAIALLGAAR